MSLLCSTLWKCSLGKCEGVKVTVLSCLRLSYLSQNWKKNRMILSNSRKPVLGNKSGLVEGTKTGRCWEKLMLSWWSWEKQGNTKFTGTTWQKHENESSTKTDSCIHPEGVEKSTLRVACVKKIWKIIEKKIAKYEKNIKLYFTIILKLCDGLMLSILSLMVHRGLFENCVQPKGHVAKYSS